MRKTALLLPALLLLAACGGDDASTPTGPSYLNIGPDRWAELITAPELETKQLEMNNLARGRPDAIPVLMVLLDHENPDVVLAAFFCLEANLKKVGRNEADVTPWLPAIEKAVASTNPRVAELAPALKARYAGD